MLHSSNFTRYSISTIKKVCAIHYLITKCLGVPLQVCSKLYKELIRINYSQQWYGSNSILHFNMIGFCVQADHLTDIR